MTKNDQQIGIILAGGKSERFGGKNAVPKPAICINQTPLVLHVASRLAAAGCDRIIVLTGANHSRLQSELGTHSPTNRLVMGEREIPMELRFSGNDTATGGRLLSIDKSELTRPALLSYTDVFCDCDLRHLLAQHEQSQTALTILAVNPQLPWGNLSLDDELVTGFAEKRIDPNQWINGGLFALSGAVLDFIKSEQESFEIEVMSHLIAAQHVSALKHAGWWRSIDSMKDVRIAHSEDSHHFSFEPGHHPALAPIE